MKWSNMDCTVKTLIVVSHEDPVKDCICYHVDMASELCKLLDSSSLGIGACPFSVTNISYSMTFLLLSCQGSDEIFLGPTCLST